MITALMWAVNDLETTRLLLERGAEVNARSDDGRGMSCFQLPENGSTNHGKDLDGNSADARSDRRALRPGFQGRRCDRLRP